MSEDGGDNKGKQQEFKDEVVKRKQQPSESSGSGSEGGKAFPSLSAFTRYQPLTNLQRGNVVQEKTTISVERSVFELAAQGEIFPGMDLDMNQVNEDGLSLVHVAATHGQLSTLKYLLNRGCDPHKKDNQGHLPIHCASHSGHQQIVKELLSRDMTLIDEVNTDGNTSLMFACYQNHCPVVQELLRSGSDISCVNNRGETAYSISVRREHKEVQSLLEKHILELIERSSSSLFQ